MELITDDHLLLKILQHTYYSFEIPYWTCDNTCILRLVCKRWRDLIDYLRSINKVYVFDSRIVNKRLINDEILNWHNIYELEYDKKK